MCHKDKLYSYQMQSQEHHDAEASSQDARKMTAQFGGAGGASGHHDQSPFNSKFTVLKFNSNGKSPIQSRGAPSKYDGISGGAKQKHQSKYTNLSPIKRNLFGNSTNNPETHSATPVPFHQNRNMQFGLFHQGGASSTDLFSHSPSPGFSSLGRIGGLLCSPLVSA